MEISFPFGQSQVRFSVSDEVKMADAVTMIRSRMAEGQAILFPTSEDGSACYLLPPGTPFRFDFGRPIADFADRLADPEFWSLVDKIEPDED